MFRLSLLFRLCSYSWLCIVYYIHDTILYKGYYLRFDLVLSIHDPCHRPELELELIQTQMAQKPMLRAEVYAHAMRASQNRKKEVRREKKV